MSRRLCPEHSTHFVGQCLKVTESVLTASEPSEAQEPVYDLTGLSQADVDLLLSGLRILENNLLPGSEKWSQATDLEDRLYML